MTSSSLSINDEGVVNVSGMLTFSTVAELSAAAPEKFGQQSELVINLADVSRSDSAGLALLIDWMRFAKNNNKSIVFQNIPDQMLAIANASGLDELIPVQIR
jgi:phospholipid transport system transporter-binding protein